MVVVMFVRLYLMEVEDCEEIDILPAVLCILCHKITDINSAMFFQDQCNFPDDNTMNEVILWSRHLGVY